MLEKHLPLPCGSGKMFFRNNVLLLEDDNIMGEYFPYEFDRNLQSLLQVHGAETIKGIGLGGLTAVVVWGNYP